MNREAGKFLRGFLLIAIVDVPLQFKGLLVIPVLTKLIGLADYGAYVQGQTIISLLVGILLMGLPQSVLRFLPALRGSPEEKRFFSSVYFLVLGISLLGCFLILSLGEPLARLVNIPSRWILVIGVIAALQSLFAISIDYYRAIEKMGYFSLLLGTKNVLDLIAGVLAALITRNIDDVFYALVIVGLLYNLVMFVLLAGKLNWSLIDKRVIRSALKFSMPLAVTSLVVWLAVLSDRLLVGMLLGSRAVGIYSVAYALAALLLFLPRWLVAVLPPMSARLHDVGEVEQVGITFSLALKYFLVVAIAFVAGLVVVAGPVLAILSTKEVMAEGYWLSIIIALSAIFLGIGQIAGVVLEVKMKTTYSMYVWVLAAVVNVSMNLVLLRVIGLYAAALSDLVAYAIVGMLLLRKATSLLPISLDAGALAKSLMAAVGMALVVNLFPVNDFLDLLRVVLLGFTVYFVMLWVLRIQTTAEASYLGQMVYGLIPGWLASPRRDI